MLTPTTHHRLSELPPAAFSGLAFVEVPERASKVVRRLDHREISKQGPHPFANGFPSIGSRI